MSLKHHTFWQLIMILAVLIAGGAHTRPAASTNEVCLPSAKH
jgi:hypothetical protein